MARIEPAVREVAEVPVRAAEQPAPPPEADDEKTEAAAPLVPRLNDFRRHIAGQSLLTVEEAQATVFQVQLLDEGPQTA
ncbi:MAG: hypothetical protein KF735_20585 [Chelatococcus sp.]|uniref:hypothetical protein n=1 Tax=Chelatococcus sp. TaxID=1953771 RepID=UPI0025C62785|nr:hypothetical protein [Chelatococcus sp.]MBX3540050.1 hypothetical protein [Chelatococcus sp.]